MHIALFGATGGTGRHVVEQALAQGHQITALVRDPSKLSPQTGLTVIEGDVLNPEPVAQCMTGAEAVICILGSHGKGTPVEARGTQHIIAAMQAQGLRRLIAVTSLGVGDSRSQIPWLLRVIMDLTLKAILAAKDEQERLIRASGLEWTIIRPGGLTDQPATGQYRSGTDRSLKGGRIARADVADFVLRQLTSTEYLQQTPVVID